MQLPYKINLLSDGSVVDDDGEFLGSWEIDETDAFHVFTPDGATEALFIAPNIPDFCERIGSWAKDRGAAKR